MAPKIRFAAIGLNHDHIYMQADCVRAAGGELIGFHADEDDLAAEFARTYPSARRMASQAEILEDPSISLIVTAAIPSDRAGIGVAAMRHGKDVMTDKPGATSLEQLAELRQVQAETGRFYSIYYEERLESRATVRACELVRAGAIGRFVHSIGLGPHTIRRESRPAWFFDRTRYGGIICDLGSHQCDQFLYLADTLEAEVAFASVENRANGSTPGLQDIGEARLTAAQASGYFRLDWFTPSGLPVFGDCRLLIVGTEGTIEVRKYIDIGHAGSEHELFLINGESVRTIDCSKVELPYGRQLVDDVLNRTETAMSQAHCFKATELALRAQAMAEQHREPYGSSR
ncbi:Gfo/Idh/MocA family protein [Dongia sedimenti]|uniref:Gfo/Idh/MocA family oxidoreductase n=1 Tax=Dongia sedimenti TaxID=3064282 RepID=A0ABU0YEN1_9PROT|nr:Gfo/Idh/MocA family oxidoreductase [Rhodospirillaceae bacterium R-7]